MLTEARFTPASERCPYPERWHSADEDSTEYEVGLLIAGLVRGLQPDLVVETGTCHGATTKLIGKALAKDGRGSLISLEIDEVRARNAQMAYGGKHVHVIHGSSLDWEPPIPVDLLFLDSAWDTRVPEFHHFSPWLHPGSIVAVHDTAVQWLRERIEDEIVRRYPVKAIDLPTPRGLTLIEVVR